MAHPRRTRSRWLLALLAPLPAAGIACVLLRREPAALAAPLLGPWAGLAFGHAECTLAAQFPRASAALLGLGALVFVGRLRATNGAVRATLAALLVLWLWAWCALAVLSVLNAAS